MEKKGMFSGWKDVFSFTAAQNIKGSSYKLVTILIGVFVAVIFGAISVIMAIMQSDHTDAIDIEDDFTKKISTVYLVENDVIQDDMMKMLVNTALTLEGVIDSTITVNSIPEDQANELMSEEKSVVVKLEDKGDKVISFNAITPSDDEDKKDVAEEYLGYVVNFIDVYGSTIAGVSEADMLYFVVPYSTQSVSVNDTAKNISVTLANALVPMIISMLLFSMVNLYGQNVTKVVVSEKSSKLMEMLLTSVKPYALITGKVLAIVSLAIGQVAGWIGFGFGGYKLGNVIATSINPDYVNYVDGIIEIISMDNGAKAFTWYSFIIAFVFVAIGFLMFSVLAALVAASISKLEDLSTGMTLFQLPVMVGWLTVYLAPLFNNKVLDKLINYVPVTSPFSVPGSIVLGKCSIIESVISLLLLCATTLGLILFTGKVYKGKLFNRK